jgi:phospholipid transport system substrate-binding protein
MQMKRLLASLIFAALALAPRPAVAVEPMEALQGPIEQVVGLLRDPRYKDGAHAEEQREKMWAVARKIFDFEAIARGTLKRYRWAEMTPAQHRDFTDAFTDFVGNNYFNQIQGKYRNERVEFLDQVMRSANKAVVRTRILREAVQIPVDYSMWMRGGAWKIYNVNIEGVSLLGNYRNEFERILQKDSMETLIKMLRDKVAEQKSSAAGPGKE